jgi:hypothetical protein
VNSGPEGALRFFVFRHGYQRRIFFFVKLKR